MPPAQRRNTDTIQGKETFRRTDRVRRRRHYLNIQKQGRLVHTTHFVMVILPNDEGRRLGITVSKRVSGAVQRNRIKRVVREVFRRNRPLFPEQSDVVMIARAGAEKLKYAAVREQIRLAGRALRQAARPAGAAADRLSTNPDETQR